MGVATALVVTAVAFAVGGAEAGPRPSPVIADRPMVDAGLDPHPEGWQRIAVGAGSFAVPSHWTVLEVTSGPSPCPNMADSATVYLAPGGVRAGGYCPGRGKRASTIVAMPISTLHMSGWQRPDDDRPIEVNGYNGTRGDHVAQFPDLDLYLSYDPLGDNTLSFEEVLQTVNSR